MPALNQSQLINSARHSGFGFRPSFGFRVSGFGLYAIARLQLCLALVLLVAGAGCTKEARKSRHLARGDRDFQAQRYDQAEIEYLKVLQVAPSNLQAIRRLGVIYQDEGKLLRAYSFLFRSSEQEAVGAQQFAFVLVDNA